MNNEINMAIETNKEMSFDIQASGGSSNYEKLSNKPKINNVELSGNKVSDDLGLQDKITSENKLSSELIDDTNNVNKFVSESEKTTWDNKYDKPFAGIPDTDLSDALQTSIQSIDDKLDTSKVKSAYSTTSGDVYDVSYINTTIGDIETLLGGI